MVFDFLLKSYGPMAYIVNAKLLMNFDMKLLMFWMILIFNENYVRFADLGPVYNKLIEHN